MIGRDVVVVDAVLHAFDFRAKENGVAPGRMHEVQLAFSSTDPKYRRYLQTREQCERQYTADEAVSCVFAESQTDIGVYHHIRSMGREGRSEDAGEVSPFAVGLRMREQAPGRVLIYGNLANPFDTERSLEEIDRLVDNHHIIGLKFYPHEWDSRTGEVNDLPLDDEKVVFPLIEHAQKRGIKVIAVHKAMGANLKTFGVADLDGACVAFPKMNFEIVHAGVAFLEDTVTLAKLPNLYLNLECTSGLVAVAPRRFAEVLGKFLVAGAGGHFVASNGSQHPADRILWATGAVFVHPQPLLELFWDFKMPEDLIEGYGYPQLTPEIKRKILGENYARMHGLDLQTMVKAIPNDDLRRAQLAGRLAEPWSKLPVFA